MAALPETTCPPVGKAPASSAMAGAASMACNMAKLSAPTVMIGHPLAELFSDTTTQRCLIDDQIMR